MKTTELAAAIRASFLTPPRAPYTNALLAVVDWCEEQREHGGTVGEDDANQVERLIAREIGILAD